MADAFKWRVALPESHGLSGFQVGNALDEPRSTEDEYVPGCSP